MLEEHLLDRFGATINPALARVFRFMGLTSVEATGQGARLIAEDGQVFLDLAAGYGAILHGYRHPRLLAAARRQLEGGLGLSSRVLLSRPQVELAEFLARITPGDLGYSFFSNSGAEAVEAAIKLARASTGRSRIVAAWGAFHGKTMGALSVSGRRQYQAPVEPLVPDVIHVPYGDSAALTSAVNGRTAAVILEPIQGEGGIWVPPPDYLPLARRLCDETGALLILDEVQTGLGRTGRLFGVDHAGVVPDLLTLAKGLSGGLIPIAATIGRARAFAAFEEHPLFHTSTFGGGALAATIAREALRVVVEEDFPAQAALKGALLREGLNDLQQRFPEIIQEVRGRGLLLGLDFGSEGLAGAFMSSLFDRRVLAVYTLNNPTVIRLMPPVVITTDEVAYALEAMEAVLMELAPLVGQLREGEKTSLDEEQEA